MRGIVKAKAVAFAKPTIYFRAQREIFTTEVARSRTGLESERATRRQSIAEFPRERAEIFLGDEVLRDIPAFKIAGKDELEFSLALFFRAAVTQNKILFGIVTNNLEQRLVGRIRSSNSK